MTWLNWEALRNIVHEERRAGASKAEIPTRIQMRIATNAEETRKLQNVQKLFIWFVTIGFVLLLLLLLVLCRFSLMVAGFSLNHWAYLVGIALIGIVSVLPFIRDISDDYISIFYLRVAVWVCVGALVLLLVLAGITYTWSIWLALTLLLAFVGLVAYLISCIRVSRRVRHSDRVTT
jgi:hypothetical protein